MIWFLGTAACLICTGFIVRSILRPKTIDISAATKDLALYKDQLREVDSDLTRGVLNEADSESAKLEISRRILAADKRAQLETLANPAPIIVMSMAPIRGVRDAVYRPRYIALLDISSTPIAARDAVYRPRYIAPLDFSSTPIVAVYLQLLLPTA